MTPMVYNTQNLVNLTSETARIAGSKPKKHTKKMGLARRISWMKKKGVTSEKIDSMIGFLSDPEIGAADIYEYIYKIKDIVEEYDVETKIKLSNSMMKLHRLVHGDKLKIQADIRSQVTVIKGYQSFSPDEWDEHKQEVIDVTPEEGE